MKIKNTLSIRSPEPDKYGTWGSRTGLSSRRRKGVQYAYEWYSPSPVANRDPSEYARPFRFISDDQIWDIYRRCSDVRASIDSIVRRVATFDWQIIPTIHPHDSRYKKALQLCEDVRGFLMRPNKNGDTWQEVMTSFLTDTLCFDSGVLELAKDDDGNLQELVPLRGASIFPIIDVHGRLLCYQQNIYATNDLYQITGGAEDMTPTFLPSQIIYFSLFKNTSNPAGNPLMESLVNEVIALLRATEHAMLNLDADEVPQGILVLAGIAGRAAEEAKADLQKLKGQDHKIRVMTTPDPSGVGASWLELKRKPKDIEMRDIILDLRRTVYRIFGVMPVEMGMTERMPLATAHAQLDVSTSHLVTPMLELLQSKINAQVIPALLRDKEDSSLVQFSFDREARYTAQEQKDLAATYQTYVRNGIMTRNEAREKLGLMPLVGGDVPTMDYAGMPHALHTLGEPPPQEEDYKVEPFKEEKDIDETVKDLIADGDMPFIEE